MKRVFSGIQPSGVIHIGNYLGAIKQWVELQDQADELIFCAVDLHAITVPQNPEELKNNIYKIVALYLACGVDPRKSSVFVQSMLPEHSELAWILNTQTKMGELARMTQFKDKTAKGGAEQSSVGLFDYPVLMAADILLYQTTHVPVGEDQKQHVEITRDIAERFNRNFGETFTLPEPIINKETARIMGLDDPGKKMSKSAESPYNYIAMTDDADTIRNKIKRAVTDSGSEIKASADKPAITNLLNIYSSITGKTISELEQEFSDQGYGQFKEALAEELVHFLAPIQESYNAYMADKPALIEILKQSADKVRPLAQKTLKDVKEKIGLGV